jgi:hypothetical protein
MCGTVKIDSRPQFVVRWIRLAFVAVVVCCAGVSTGCMHRRMTIRSDPPGALVLVDGNEIGYSPAQTDFTYYGTREITLVKDGFETVTTMQKVRTPWYQVFPLDFVSDNLLPFKVTNRHEFNYRMRPQEIPPTDELIERASGLRSEAQLGP